MTFLLEWIEKFAWPLQTYSQLPLAIAHRGASDYRLENTKSAFELASELGAQMWETDVRLSADGVVVVSHDDDLKRVSGQDLKISTSTWAEIQAVDLPEGERILRLEDVIALAKRLGAGLYVEVKAEGAALASWKLLYQNSFRFAVIGSFVPEWIEGLSRAGCQLPLSVLVPAHADPFEYAKQSNPDILHLCWREASDAPHELVTDTLLARCHDHGIAVVTWHEDRAAVIQSLKNKTYWAFAQTAQRCCGRHARYRMRARKGTSLWL